MICLMGASKPRVWWKLVYLVPVVARPCTRSSEPRPGQSRKESPFDPTEATASHLARAAPQRIDLYCTPRSQVMHQTRQVGPLTFTLPDGHLQGVPGQGGAHACGGFLGEIPRHPRFIQYLAISGSISCAHAAMPPAKLYSSSNPACSKKRATFRLRKPW